jgi:hypothetical protein
LVAFRKNLHWNNRRSAHRNWNMFHLEQALIREKAGDWERHATC